LSWISVASVVNLTTALRQEGFRTGVVGGSVDWALMWIVILTIFGCLLALNRGDSLYGLVCSWALLGIERMQSIEDNTRFPIKQLSSSVAHWADICSIIVSVMVIISLFKNTYEIACIRRKRNQV